MLINADCTIYEKDSYVKHIISDVYWNDSRGRVTSKAGVQISDQIVVYLYETDYVPKAGDIIVKGESSFVFDVSSAQAVSESLKLFRENYSGFAVIKNVQDARYGGLQHIEVLAR